MNILILYFCYFLIVSSNYMELFIETIKDKKIALVGPSCYLKGKNLGKVIDSYDVVIKINNFEKLSAKDYGNKVDILSFNFYKQCPNESIKTRDTTLIIAAHSFNNFPVNNRCFEHSKKQYSVIPHELYPYDSLDEYFRTKCNNGRWKSSGFFLICLLLNNIDIVHSLTLFGVDFCFNSYSPDYGIISIGPHNMDKEVKLFMEMYDKFKGSNKIHIHDKEFLKYLLKNDTEMIKFKNDGAITAVIPVRIGSTRCKNKNIRNFGDTNLLKLKIETLKKVNGIDRILVSSNCDIMLDVAKTMDVDIHKRDEIYCTNANPGSFFCNLADTIKTNILMHVPVTSPLISTDDYNKIIARWNEIKLEHDSLNTTTVLKEFIWYDNEPVNYERTTPPPSQELPPFKKLNFGCNVISKESVLKYNNIVGVKPYLFDIDAISGLDIDENSEFITSELLYNNNILSSDTCKYMLEKRVDNPEIVDCTIRDGGYLNNWNHSDEEIIDCYKAVTNAGIDYFEIGFKSDIKLIPGKGKWCYSSEEDISEIVKQYRGTKICVMAKIGTVNINDFVEKQFSDICMVRVLIPRMSTEGIEKISEYSKKDILTAKSFCNELLQLGYEVCINLSCGDLINDRELTMIAETLHDTNIKCLYLADTYGGFNSENIPKQLHKIYKYFDKYNSNIRLGLHVHNNNGNGLEKAKVAIYHGCNMIDTSIFGLGRGAGNLKIEEYLCSNYTCIEDFESKISSILYYYDKHIQSKIEYNQQKIKLHHPFYNIAGALSLHPDYILELLQNTDQDIITDIKIIFKLNIYTVENICRNYDKTLITKLSIQD